MRRFPTAMASPSKAPRIRDTALLAFSGAPVTSLFNATQGDVSFSMQSRYNLSERITAMPSEYVFQVDDGSQRLFYFSVGTSGSRLVFYMATSGGNNYYTVPVGEENLLFGKNVVAKFRMTWDGLQAALYVNDENVLSFPYVALASTWSPASSFTIGATSLNIYGGGYYPAGDSIADFRIEPSTVDPTLIPQASLSRSSLTFGSQSLGSTSVAQNVILSNTGTAALNIAGITVTGANAADFAQTNTCGRSIPVGSSCSIAVTFTPKAVGSRAAAVTITDTAQGSPHAIALAGTAAGVPQASLSAASLTFATQNIGTTSAAQSVKLSNPGSATLTIAGISVTGVNAADFAQTSTCGTSLPSGGSCTITATFTPAAPGGRNAAVTVTDNAAGSPHSVALSGIGIQAGMLAFSLRGINSEVPSLVNDAVVTPTTAPAGLTGKVVVRGTGAVTYAPLPNGDGLSFNGTQSTNTAFLAFSGAPVGSLFNSAHGDVTFSMQSDYTFAERAAAMPSEYVFQVDNGSQRMFYFAIGVSNSRLVFYVGASGVNNYFYAPIGQEELLFGKNVAAKFRMTWNGSRAVLYMNDASILSYAYTPVAATWSPASSFTIGATSANMYGGGYYPAGDSIADFEMK